MFQEHMLKWLHFWTYFIWYNFLPLLSYVTCMVLDVWKWIGIVKECMRHFALMEKHVSCSCLQCNRRHMNSIVWTGTCSVINHLKGISGGTKILFAIYIFMWNFIEFYSYLMSLLLRHCCWDVLKDVGNRLYSSYHLYYFSFGRERKLTPERNSGIFVMLATGRSVSEVTVRKNMLQEISMFCFIKEVMFSATDKHDATVLWHFM